MSKKNRFKLEAEDTASLLKEIAAAGGIGIVRPTRRAQSPVTAASVASQRADGFDAQAEREADAIAFFDELNENAVVGRKAFSRAIPADLAIRWSETERKYITLRAASARCNVPADYWFAPAESVEQVYGAIFPRRETTRRERAATTARNTRQREERIVSRAASVGATMLARARELILSRRGKPAA